MDLSDMHREFESKFAALDPVADGHAIYVLEGDFADAVIKYANEHPERLDWRTFLQKELRTVSRFTGYFLNTLTLFPENGLFLQAEVLKLTDNSDQYIRGWAMEVLVMWVYDLQCVPDDPTMWVNYLRKRLTDDGTDFRVREEIWEEAQYLLDWVIGGCIPTNRHDNL